MNAIGLVPMGEGDTFEHRYPTQAHPDRLQMMPDGTIAPGEVEFGYNLVGLLPGVDPARADEYIVYTAHYDHLGVDDQGRVYNGAYDNATGVAVGLEIAKVLIEHNAAPGRSLIFLFTDDEENGLTGAKQWLADSNITLDSIVLGISGDPLGRSLLPDYRCILMSGLERSPALLTRFREFEDFAQMPVVFVHREVIPFFASDQDEYHRAETPVPAAWFINPGFTFYHQIRDTPETVDYRALLDDARFMAQALFELGEDDQRYAYEGPPRIGRESATDLIALLDGILTSTVLTSEERTRVEEIRARVVDVQRADTIEAIPNSEAFLVDAVFFTMFLLSIEHPGEVPPPFPEP